MKHKIRQPRPRTAVQLKLYIKQKLVLLCVVKSGKLAPVPAFMERVAFTFYPISFIGIGVVLLFEVELKTTFFDCTILTLYTISVTIWHHICIVQAVRWCSGQRGLGFDPQTLSHTSVDEFLGHMDKSNGTLENCLDR